MKLMIELSSHFTSNQYVSSIFAKLIHIAKNLFFLVILYDLVVFYLLLMQVYFLDTDFAKNNKFNSRNYYE
jgi:hypothetical protein